MADFDSKLPIRSLAVDNCTEIANSSGTTINPAKEDGNLATLAAWDNGSAKANVVIQSDATVDLNKVKGTSTAVNTGNSDAGTQRVVLASDQPAVSVTGPAAGMDVNLLKVAGTATTVNTGNAGAGTQRVVLASDQPTVSVSLAANQSVNVAQIAGTATAVNTGNASNGTQRVVIASDQPTLPVSFSNSTVEIADFHKSASPVAANATDTHTYTPLVTTKYLDQVDASASGQCKVEVKVGTIGGETTRWVGFTSKGNLFVSWKLPNPIAVPITDDVLVIVTNMDNQSMDVYSTIQLH